MPNNILNVAIQLNQVFKLLCHITKEILSQADLLNVYKSHEQQVQWSEN